MSKLHSALLAYACVIFLLSLLPFRGAIFGFSCLCAFTSMAVIWLLFKKPL